LSATLYNDWIEAVGNRVQRSGESLRGFEGMEDCKSECDCAIYAVWNFLPCEYWSVWYNTNEFVFIECNMEMIVDMWMVKTQW